MISAKIARDNFVNTYGSDIVNDRLLRLWCNDCAKKFVSVESTSFAKAKLLDVEYQNVDLGEDFNRIIQVWFAPGMINEKRHDVLETVAKVCGVEKTYKTKCGEDKVRCEVELNNPTDYFADPALNSIYRLSKSLVSFNKIMLSNRHTHSQNTNFVYVRPSINSMDFARYVIPCNDAPPSDLVYQIRDRKLTLSYPEGTALVLYYALPIDKDGYYLFPDKTEFWEAINSYVLFKHGEVQYVKDPTPTNERFWKNMEYDYLKKLGSAKRKLEEIQDIKEFMAKYIDVTHRVLGRKYNENPLE